MFCIAPALLLVMRRAVTRQTAQGEERRQRRPLERFVVGGGLCEFTHTPYAAKRDRKILARFSVALENACFVIPRRFDL